MEESDTYLMILEEGMAIAARDIILMMGKDRIGPPDESVKARLNDITDLDRLRRMVRLATNAANWRSILDIP